MFKVLILAYYFPPMGLSGVQRVTKFVKYLPQFGWSPRVITCEPGTYYAFDETLLSDIPGDKVTIHRIKGKEVNSVLPKKGTVEMPSELTRKTLSAISSIFFIPDNKKSWSKKAYNFAKELLRKESFDLIFVSGPPFSTFTFASKLKKEFSVPLIFDYRDLWYGNQFAIYPTPIHKSLIMGAEYKALKAADKVIVTNRRIKEKLMEYYKFLQFSDVTILPHGFDPEDMTTSEVPAGYEGDYFHVTYSGIFYEYITPKYFLEAFALLIQSNPEIAKKIKLHFVGLLRKENRKLLTKLNLQDYIIEHGYLPHKEAVGALLKSDLLWFMVGKGRNSDTISSGKMFEYIGTGKPILACLDDGALKSILSEYNGAAIVPSDNPEMIKQELINLFNAHSSNSLPVIDEEFKQKYRRDLMTETLSKEFNAALKV